MVASAAADANAATSEASATENISTTPDSSADRVEQLPQMPFGKTTISRLIVGSNCFAAGSHLSVFVDREMAAYYTPEQIQRTVRRCEDVGVNCWQISGTQYLDLYCGLRDEGSRMRCISIDSDSNLDHLPALAAAGCLGVAHHGEASDSLFKRGDIQRIGEYLKRVHDAGMMAGVSTHMPDVVDAIESAGFEVDYYMTCVYERHRSEEDLKQLLGMVPLPPREVYLREDPDRMFNAVRRTERPCLAFKILAAGRLSEGSWMVERAFRETFEAIRPTDGVIVGIYDKFTDQPAENAEYARRFGTVVS